MIGHIMNRMPNRPRISISLILLLVLMMPPRSEASPITSSANAEALREVLTASSSALSNNALRDILNAGSPVSETSTTTFSDGATQIDDLLIVPNTSTGTVTTTKTINLADGETEKVVDVATISGNTIKHIVTTTLPDGSIQTKQETDVTKGDETIIKGTVSIPGAGIQTISGTNVQSGSASVTTETITNPDGKVYHDRIVITLTGPLSQSETNTTLGPDGSSSTVKSITSSILNPSTVGQNDTAMNVPLPLPACRPNRSMSRRRCWCLRPRPVTNEPTVLPTPLPEPSTLTIFAVVLGAVGLRYGFNTRRRR